MDVIASDISMEALKVAKENNDALHANVSFICGSMLDPFVDRDLHCDIWSAIRLIYQVKKRWSIVL